MRAVILLVAMSGCGATETGLAPCDLRLSAPATMIESSDSGDGNSCLVIRGSQTDPLAVYARMDAASKGVSVELQMIPRRDALGHDLKFSFSSPVWFCNDWIDPNAFSVHSYSDMATGTQIYDLTLDLTCIEDGAPMHGAFHFSGSE